MSDHNRALVLAGGGLAGIAWETGVLLGISDEIPEAAQALLDSDVLLGTSAGSTVAAQIGSGLPLGELFARQVAAGETHEIHPGVSVEAVTDLFLNAMLLRFYGHCGPIILGLRAIYTALIPQIGGE